ncbi:P-loop NTPase [bacterium]|nr:P-loop NTPase [bacterium]
MNQSENFDIGLNGSQDPRDRHHDSHRETSNRLPARAGRRKGVRPDVDPDLEQFLTSAEFKTWPDWKSISSDPIEVFEPEEIKAEATAQPFPTWQKLSDTSAFGQAPPAVETVHQIVHVPAPEPLFPDMFGTSQDAPSDPDRAVRVIVRRFPIFLFVAILIWCATGLYVTYVAPGYQSETTLLVDTQGFQNEIKDLPRLNTESAPLGSSKLANQTLILQSSSELSTRAAAELSAIRAETPDAADWTIFDKQTERAHNGVTVASLLRNDYVQVAGSAGDSSEPDAIMITVSSTDPQEAALIANVYGRTYVQHVDVLISRHFQEALDYYNLRRDNQSDKVESVTEELKTFMRSDGSLFGQEESKHVLDQISSLTSSMDDTSIEIEELKASIETLETEMSLMDGQLVAERTAHGIEDQLNQSYERIATLNIQIEQYYVKNPELRLDPSASKQLVDMLSERNMLQTQVGGLSQDYSDSITSVGGVDLRSYDGAISYMAKLRRTLSENRVLLNAARAKESATLVRLADYEGRRKSMPEREVEYKDISSRHQFALDQLQDVEEKIRVVEEASDARRAFVRVLNPAVVPINPKTNPKLILILGGLFGLLAGIGAALVSEKTDRRLYEETDIEKLGLDVICTTPNIRNVSRKSKRVYYDRKISSEMVTILNPDSPATRSLRSIPLRFVGNRLKNSIFVFTGIETGVGTSFLAANTAASLAKSGARVLLVDANIHRPSIKNILGLTAQADFDLEAFSFASGKGIEVFSSYLPNLFALSVDTSKHVNQDILLSNNLIPLIQQVKSQFDAIVVDTASLSTSTTALGLSTISDELILVVRSGASDGRRLKDMADDIRGTTGSSVRAILNGFDSVRLSNKKS